MVNNTTSAVTFTVQANNYRSDGPWTYTLPAGTTASDYWNAELYGNCWYDLFATASSDSTSFLEGKADNLKYLILMIDISLLI